MMWLCVDVVVDNGLYGLYNIILVIVGVSVLGVMLEVTAEE